MRKKYRLFTNDRGTRAGVKLYSGLLDVMASNPAEAALKCPVGFGKAVAIRWPEKFWSATDRAWLERHVFPV